MAYQHIADPHDRGQSLQPITRHQAVACYVIPDEFAIHERAARGEGFLMVSATPLTRSSYHAGDDFERLRAARERGLNRVRPAS